MPNLYSDFSEKGKSKEEQEKEDIILRDDIKALISLVPPIKLIWDLAESHYGVAIKIRYKRAQEWLTLSLLMKHRSATLHPQYHYFIEQKEP